MQQFSCLWYFVSATLIAAALCLRCFATAKTVTPIAEAHPSSSTPHITAAPSLWYSASLDPITAAYYPHSLSAATSTAATSFPCCLAADTSIAAVTAASYPDSGLISGADRGDTAAAEIWRWMSISPCACFVRACNVGSQCFGL